MGCEVDSARGWYYHLVAVAAVAMGGRRPGSDCWRSTRHQASPWGSCGSCCTSCLIHDVHVCWIHWQHMCATHVPVSDGAAPCVTVAQVITLIRAQPWGHHIICSRLGSRIVCQDVCSIA
jgi:hypothetical protein